MMSPVIARVQQVLKDYLEDELALIDTDAADSFTSTVIPADSNHYFDWDRQYVPEFPACTAGDVQSIPVGVLASGMGSRVDVVHRINLRFHATLANVDGGQPRDLQKLLHRYVCGAVRVLTIQHDGLDTIADPTRWGSPTVTTIATWSQAATYGPEEEQADGAIVRTATLPIDVRRIEPR